MQCNKYYIGNIIGIKNVHSNVKTYFILGCGITSIEGDKTRILKRIH